MVTRARFELAIFALKGRRTNRYTTGPYSEYVVGPTGFEPVTNWL